MMSIQKNLDVNTSQKKDKWIQIRIDEETKEILKEKASSENKSLSKYILEIVLTNIKDVNTSILIDGILEFNKLMSQVRPKIPNNIDKNKIKEAIKICPEI